MKNFGLLLAYPENSWKEDLLTCQQEVKKWPPEVGEALRAFESGIGQRRLEEVQELYTQTFDMDPSRTLEIGWHLFGEQYERGAFLVKLRQHMRELGIAENHELPDHLTHVLEILTQLNPQDSRKLALEFVIPALNKIKDSFKDDGNPYRHAVVLIAAVLEHWTNPVKGETDEIRVS